MANLNLKKELDNLINEDKISKNSINSKILQILKEELKINKILLNKFKKNFMNFLRRNFRR